MTELKKQQFSHLFVRPNGIVSCLITLKSTFPPFEELSLTKSIFSLVFL